MRLSILSTVDNCLFREEFDEFCFFIVIIIKNILDKKLRLHNVDDTSLGSLSVEVTVCRRVSCCVVRD